MDYDIIIGKGDYTKGSFISCDLNNKIDPIRISQNDIVYNVLYCIMDIKILIYKNTPEGMRLKDYIKKDEYRKIIKQTHLIIFRKGNLYVLNLKYHQTINKIYEKAYLKGREDKSTEIMKIIYNK